MILLLALSLNLVKAIASENFQTAVAKQLAPIVFNSIQTPTPFFGDAPTGGIFRNSYDWHSSVHAHWALLSMSKKLQDAELLAWVTKRLETGLPKEREYLKNNPNFEMPYGRVWLLLLLSEIEKEPHFAESPLVRSFRQEIEIQIGDWLLQTQPNCRGDYLSWPFVYFLYSKTHTENPALLKILQQKSKLISCNSTTVSSNDFISLNSLFAMLSSKERTAPASLDFPDSLTLWNCHSWGALISEAWPIDPDIKPLNAKLSLTGW
jgi:hypothetical protein